MHIPNAPAIAPALARIPSLTASEAPFARAVPPAPIGPEIAPKIVSIVFLSKKRLISLTDVPIAVSQTLTKLVAVCKRT